MSPNDLFRALREQPFRPFQLVMTDGSVHNVMHPEMLMVGVRTSHLGVQSADQADLGDYTIKLDNLHVIKMVPLGSVAAQPT